MWYRIISISHLPMLIFICHTSTHCSILNISLLISRHSLMVFAFLYNVASSAFEIVFELHTFSHKYLIYKRKTNDQNTVPRGIPLLKICDIETFESISHAVFDCTENLQTILIQIHQYLKNEIHKVTQYVELFRKLSLSKNSVQSFKQSSSFLVVERCEREPCCLVGKTS